MLWRKLRESKNGTPHTLGEIRSNPLYAELGECVVPTVEELVSNLVREQSKVHIVIAVIFYPNLLIDTLIGEM
jgi:hypothetical protein